MSLSHGELVAAFEARELPAEAFGHTEHVRLAWLYLRRYSVEEARRRLSQGLQAFAETAGHPERYHETLTCAFVYLVHQRMAASPAADRSEPWEAFSRDNPDLLAWRPSLLDRYYRPETLASELARQIFVLPDRGLSEAS